MYDIGDIGVGFPSLTFPINGAFANTLTPIIPGARHRGLRGSGYAAIDPAADRPSLERINKTRRVVTLFTKRAPLATADLRDL